MTKTTIEKLNEAIDKVHGVNSQLTSEIRATLGEVNELHSKIHSNRSLTGIGRDEEFEKVQQQQAEKMFLRLQELRADYDKGVKEARQLALQTLAQSSQEPADKVALTLFEKDLKTLRTSVMLDLTPAAAIKKIEEFASKYNDAYYVEQLADVFGELSQNIVALDGSVQTRQQLGRVFKGVQELTLTDEKRAANDAITFFDVAENRPFFIDPNGTHAGTNPQITGLKQIVGPKYIRFVNDPQKGLETIDPTYATM